MRIRTIGLIVTLVLGLLIAALSAEAQQAKKIHRIGYLSRRWTESAKHQIAAFKQGMRELGFVEGQNYVIEYRNAKGEKERLPEVAAEMVRLQVDVILTSPSPPMIRAAQRATRTIPIVIPVINIDPVEAGFVVSLARPGGNITGMTSIELELHPKRLELLKETFPQISRVAILWPPTQHNPAIKAVKAVGQVLGIQIQTVAAARRLGGIESALSAISRENPDGLLVSSYRFLRTHRARIIEFTAKRRLPAIYATGQFVKAGGLMSYGTDQHQLWRRAATYVDKILKGAKPADLPVEQPTKFNLVINLKTAKQLGITIPPKILYQATKVIK